MIRFMFLAFLTLFFTGCATKKESIYYWDGSYSKSLYEYFNQEGDINAQIADLENLIQSAYEKK